ncbi:MAG: hypothetical protein QOH88_1548 [Verrucomicrobiota bacterium]|jgi:hypothetical protein
MMPKISSSSDKKEAKKKIEENWEKALGCNEPNNRKDGGKHDGQEEKEWPARRLSDGEEHEARAEPNNATDHGAKQSQSDRHSHGPNDNGTDWQALT